MKIKDRWDKRALYTCQNWYMYWIYVVAKYSVLSRPTFRVFVKGIFGTRKQSEGRLLEDWDICSHPNDAIEQAVLGKIKTSDINLNH